MTQATRPTAITCARPGCGRQKGVGKSGPIPTYCSLTCRAKLSAERAKTDGRYEAALTAARQQTKELQVQNARPCPYCKVPMLHPRRRQCGSPECKRAYGAERGREWHHRYQAQTGIRYATDRYAEQEREYERRRREERPHWRTLHPERAAEYDARRRASVALARTGEAFAPRDVHERDQWTCQLCQLPVDPELAWPHSMSASVDHVVPLSRGGEHSMANVQCAHLGCNSRKGDRLPGEGEPRVAQG